jgi:glutathione S-transferase
VNAFVTRTPGKTVKPDELADAMHRVASEARSIEARLAKSDWVVGESFSAADIMIFPSLQLLLRALAKPEARDLSSRFLPLQVNYPALSRWIERVEKLPGYEKTYPPHWRR